MSETTKLKPCPCCGGVAHISHDPCPDGGGRYAFAKCGKCGMQSRHKYHSYGNDCPQTYAEIRDDWNTRAAPMVKPLVWDIDSRAYRLDDGMVMGKGYDWDGYEVMRQEAHGLGFGYIIWPDSISSDQFSLYGTADGLYIQSLTEDEAKAAAQADYTRRILEALA